MKVAAYQSPLLPCGSMDAIELIHKRVDWCKREGVEILCCPEAVLGGLVDYEPRPIDFALNVESGQLSAVLAPLASDTVTTILGFTEICGTDQLFNSAVIFHKGVVVGVYRKLYPAIRKSIYQGGDQIPVFTIGGLTFGILICNDSNHFDPARKMASQGATALFVPTNNGLSADAADVVADARNADIALAVANNVTGIRADVAGRTGNLVSYGSSAIVGADGTVLQTAQRLSEDLLVEDLAMVHSQ